MRENHGDEAQLRELVVRDEPPNCQYGTEMLTHAHGTAGMAAQHFVPHSHYGLLTIFALESKSLLWDVSLRIHLLRRAGWCPPLPKRPDRASRAPSWGRTRPLDPVPGRKSSIEAWNSRGGGVIAVVEWPGPLGPYQE